MDIRNISQTVTLKGIFSKGAKKRAFHKLGAHPNNIPYREVSLMSSLGLPDTNLVSRDIVI